ESRRRSFRARGQCLAKWTEPSFALVNLQQLAQTIDITTIIFRGPPPLCQYSPGRRGGRIVTPDPWTATVQRHADAVVRKAPAAGSEAINSSPVVTPRKREKSAAVRGAPVDKRGHIRVRPVLRAHRLSCVHVPHDDLSGLVHRGAPEVVRREAETADFAQSPVEARQHAPSVIPQEDSSRVVAGGE